jgi:hypothetical protein
LRAGWTQLFGEERWEWGITGFGTLLPFGGAGTGLTDPALRFLGVNARIGYRLAQNPRGVSASLLTGLYYTTTFSAGSRPFGFSNLVGPQIYLMLSTTVGGAARPPVLGIYGKFAPVSDSLGLGSLSNREIAAGIFWRMMLGNGHPLGLGADWSQLLLANSLTALNVSTYGAGLNYWF